MDLRRVFFIGNIVLLGIAPSFTYAFSSSSLDDFLDQLDEDIQDEVDDIEQQIEDLEEGQTPSEALQEQIDQNAQTITSLANNVSQNADSELEKELLDVNNEADRAVLSLEDAIGQYDDKAVYYAKLAADAKEQGLTSLENAYTAMSEAWREMMNKYESELQVQYEDILSDITASEDSSFVLVGQEAQFENVSESDETVPELFPSSSIGFNSSSKGFSIPLSFTVSDWSRVSVVTPYSKGSFRSPLLTLGLFTNDVLFDYIGIRSQLLLDDDLRYGYGIKVKERIGSLALLVDYSLGQTNYDYDYMSWHYGVGWQFDDAMVYGIYNQTEIEPETTSTRLSSNDITFGVQSKITLFGIYPPGINLNVSVITPQKNEMRFREETKELDGEGWRYQFGMSAAF
ncbi:hypothetical protein [Marinomonas balearica]|uniref:Uncharacterized protein n=1 Tax=Marinomonas balearica TaxID=491947 RepID=A0A4R6MEE0_9GAMM|nr:hypothetical protein [Marinomonas balearica]TDP00004.1 hypothetical protein DFP79_1022 [Marinomonas balearica]